MPTAAAKSAPPSHLTLYEAASVMYPGQRGAYFRVYMAIRRHEKSCPIKFQYLRSAANGRKSRFLHRNEVPTLKRWLDNLDRS
jgi:hypothetical protein